MASRKDGHERGAREQQGFGDRHGSPRAVLPIARDYFCVGMTTVVLSTFTPAPAGYA